MLGINYKESDSLHRYILKVRIRSFLLEEEDIHPDFIYRPNVVD